MENGWSWCWRLKGSDQAASGQPFSFTTSLMAPFSGLFVIAIKSTSPYTTTIGSRTGVDLEVIFFVGLQSTLLEAHARFPGFLKTRAMVMRRYCSVDERPRCGYEVMMTWCQDDVYRSCVKIMWMVTCKNHLSRSCEWSRIKIMWLVGLLTMTLQLPSFLNASFVKHVVVCLKKNLE